MFEETKTLTGRLGMWPQAMDKQQMQGLPTRLISDLSEAKAILDRVEEVARLQTIYAEKLARVNATIPDPITATKGERDAYQLLYQASHEACRAVQSAALKLAADAPGLFKAS